MRHGLVLFTSDRGVTPAVLARAAEDRGFDSFYVPEHTHIPVRREAAHPGTGDATLPDERYLRTLDPWVTLASVAAVTSRIRLATAVALPVEHDPITLAKSIATLDHLSGGRVTVGVGFGWNTDELADHGIPADQRRGALADYLAAMRALWHQDEASHDGPFVTFGPSWAWPKPIQSQIPVLLGAEAGPRTVRWIAQHADGWLTTPRTDDVRGRVTALQDAWASAGRAGSPAVHVLVAARPTPADLTGWINLGVDELIWGVPDAEESAVMASLDKLATKIAGLR